MRFTCDITYTDGTTEKSVTLSTVDESDEGNLELEHTDVFIVTEDNLTNNMIFANSIRKMENITF